ncbi:MAG: hypothetical protein JRJ85_02560 [Deltaproteobacteria bacterium]|nr:hypothetical protein [Deltaproteobacteria bacterium]
MPEKIGKVNAVRIAENQDGAISAYIDLAIDATKGKFKGSKLLTLNAYDAFASQAEGLAVGQEILVIYREISPKDGKPKYKKIEGLMI